MDCMAVKKPQRRMASSSRACPPQAEFWCSSPGATTECEFDLACKPRLPNRLELLLAQITAVEAEQDALLAAVSKPAGENAAPAPVTMLLALKGMGANFAAVLWSEAFYRQFSNRRQLAAYAGLAPTPWRSGGIEREQGVSKAGNPRLRTTMIQLAWLWLRHQDRSALTRWFKAHSQRGRKSAIVALARKLLIALWRLVTTGEVPAGVVLRAA